MKLNNEAKEHCKKFGHILKLSENNIIHDLYNISNEYECECCDVLFYFPPNQFPINPFKALDRCEYYL